jgi:nucleotide-binding universal stress UspA family protein
MDHFPMRILLATDGSEDAAVATRAAMDLADRSGSELHVVHAFEFVPPREYMSVALRLHSPSDFSRHGRRLLDEQVGRIEEAGGVVAGALLRTGSPVDQILYASEELEAGLVVVGRRGLGGVKRLLMGSVSEGVVHHARCPVLVLRNGEEVWPPPTSSWRTTPPKTPRRQRSWPRASAASSGPRASWCRSTRGC